MRFTTTRPTIPRTPAILRNRVHWGEQTTDEMCLCGMTVVTNTPADLKKVRAMNFAAARGDHGRRLAAGRARRTGALRSREIDSATRKKVLAHLPADGFPIPETSKAHLAPFDLNHDGRLTAAEIEAMPEPLRSLIVDAIRKKVEAADQAKKK